MTSPRDPDLLRPLGATEACLWHVDKASRINFAMVAQVAGLLELADLRRALDVVQARHPLLSAEIVTRRGAPWFARRGGTPLPLREVSDEAWVETAEHELETPFDPAKPALARCVVVRGSGNPTLILTFHHSIGDARSGTLLLGELLASVAGEGAPAPLPLRASLERSSPREGRGLRRWLGFGGSVCGTWGWMLRHGRPRGIGAAPDDGAPRRARIVPRTLEPATTRALTDRARLEGTTVHGALAAAMLLAVGEEDGRPSCRMLASPVDVRDRLVPPADGDLGLFVSMGVSLHRVDPESSEFWDLARDVRDRLVTFVERGRHLQLLPTHSALLAPLVRWTSPARFARILQAIQRVGPKPGIALTNIGRVSLPSPGGLRVASLGFVVSMSTLGDFGATAASVDDSLQWNFMCMEPAVSHERAAAIADRSVAHVLRAAAATDPRAGCAAS